MFFIKKYYPMVVSVVFMAIYGFLFGAIFSQNSYILESDTPLMYVFLILVLLLVIIIWAEIIGFIIHAAKNKKLKKNNILWCILIYFLNIFIIPYYNLKHVWNEKKVTLPMIIYGFLLLGSFVGTMIIPFTMNSDVGAYTKTYVVDDTREVEFLFYGNYIERDLDEYDLYATDFKRGINVGAFVYDEEDTNLNNVQTLRRDWIKSARENVRKIDNYFTQLEDRNILSESFYGEIDNEGYVYTISTIDFKYDDSIVNVLQVTFDEDYEKYKEELKQILVDVRVLD